MVKAIGFRRLLPIANCLLYVALLCFDNGHGITSSQPVSDVDAVPIPLRLVVAANVPAVLVAFAIRAVFHFQLRNPFLLAIPFIPLLWYPVGSWIDRRLGWSPSRKRVRNRLRDVLLILAVLIACFAMQVFVQRFKVLYPRPTDPFWAGYGIWLWFLFLVAVLARMVYGRFANSQ
jgi:hypothetical protein